MLLLKPIHVNLWQISTASLRMAASSFILNPATLITQNLQFW